MGPPYMPETASLGGVPTVSVDIPVCAVFLALFVVGAASHMTILRLNRRRGHKFLMSALMYGFCMARSVTCVMRIIWACYPTNVHLAIAATIFVSAGVIILFVVNLVFAQRILRAAHPSFGWHRAMSNVFKVVYILIILMLLVVIAAIVHSYYTLSRNTHRIHRILQLGAMTYFMSVAVAPIPMVILGLIAPRKTRVEKFGTGRWRTKIWILLATATLLTLGASFRAGTSFRNPRLRENPAWYDANWCFYVLNFAIEMIVVFLYVILRIDRRFHVPNGSHGPGDYARGKEDPALDREADGRGSFSSVGRILSEEEVFDDSDEPVFRVGKIEDLDGIHHHPFVDGPYLDVGISVEIWTVLANRNSWARH
jgi:Protein of unknown function (DUF3112)